jgi:hypothetical protein
LIIGRGKEMIAQDYSKPCETLNIVDAVHTGVTVFVVLVGILFLIATLYEIYLTKRHSLLVARNIKHCMGENYDNRA